jgi:hypothetical protein
VTDFDDIGADNAQAAAEATPNPKPRKQSKHHSRSYSVDSPTRSTFSGAPSNEGFKVPEIPSHRKSRTLSRQQFHPSPHATNPSANFVPPESISRGRKSSSRLRSSTPVPAYEPPREQFTPPREVFVAPISSSRVSKRNKRQTVAKKLDLRVKTEPPDVDLTLPLPPPSPTDDPLLLSGRPRPRPAASRIASSNRKQRLAALKIDPIPAFKGRAIQSQNYAANIPSATLSPSTLDDADDTVNFNSEVVESMPEFGTNDPGDYHGGWSDSDSDGDVELDHPGEYRETFTNLTVPTKMDSPSSQNDGDVDGPSLPNRDSLGVGTNAPEPVSDQMVTDDSYDMDVEDAEDSGQDGSGSGSDINDAFGATKEKENIFLEPTRVLFQNHVPEYPDREMAYEEPVEDNSVLMESLVVDELEQSGEDSQIGSTSVSSTDSHADASAAEENVLTDSPDRPYDSMDVSMLQTADSDEEEVEVTAEPQPSHELTDEEEVDSGMRSSLHILVDQNTNHG